MKKKLKIHWVLAICAVLHSVLFSLIKISGISLDFKKLVAYWGTFILISIAYSINSKDDIKEGKL